MHKVWLIRLVIAVACLLPFSAWADQDGPSWVPEIGIEAGLTAGDSNVVGPRFTGQPAKTPSNVYLAPGDTFYLQGYYRQAVGHTGLSLKAAAGASYACMAPACIDTIAAVFLSDGNTSGGAQPGTYQFNNFTGDLALEYAWDGGRIGAGRTVRADNYLISNSNAYPFKDVHLKPAQGWFLEYEWGRTGLRYTHIIYRSNVSGASINGSNVGIYVHRNFNDEEWYPGGKYFEEGVGMVRQDVALVFHPQQWGF
jgi:hypothetical protein